MGYKIKGIKGQPPDLQCELYNPPNEDQVAVIRCSLMKYQGH